jgi:hypothetical protein
MEDKDFRNYPPAPHIRVSRDGVVQSGLERGKAGTKRRLSWRTLAVRYTKGKYPRVFFARKADVAPEDEDHNRASARLQDVVAWAWIGPPPGDDYKVRPKDGNPLNIHANNLQWVSRTAKPKPKTVAHDRRCKLTPEQREDIRSARECGVKLKVLAERYKVSIACVSVVANKELQCLPPSD